MKTENTESREQWANMIAEWQLELIRRHQRMTVAEAYRLHLYDKFYTLHSNHILRDLWQSTYDYDRSSFSAAPSA